MAYRSVSGGRAMVPGGGSVDRVPGLIAISTRHLEVTALVGAVLYLKKGGGGAHECLLEITAVNGGFGR